MKRSKHSLSHYKLATMDMGKLVPVGCFEVLPGDTIQQATSALVRVSPLMAPVMHPASVRIHHWFVPTRLIWENFEDFITGADPNQVPPVIQAPNVTKGSLYDYFGIPVANYQNVNVSALPIRAYNKIYNEYYRDQDLCDEVSQGNAEVLPIAWEKDYFTSCRPWPQKGDDITVPIGDTAPIVGDNTTIQFGGVNIQMRNAADGGGAARSMSSDAASGQMRASDPQVAGENLYDWLPDDERDIQDIADHLNADLSAVTGMNIIDIRRAFALQRYQEARAMYGSRYTEYLRYLGVRSSDARLGRPEYLGGGKQTITFTEILQTGPDSQDEGVGMLKGHGIAAMRTRKYRKFFDEHGYVLTLMSVRPRAMYADGINRMWSRTTKEDYWQKELEMIGQQEVLNKEIYALSATPNETFGYQDRYAEYRHIPSTIAGDFRDTLNHWHLARLFGSEPVLNEDFVNCTPSKRIHAVTSEHVLWNMISHSIQARRMVAKTASGKLL